MDIEKELEGLFNDPLLDISGKEQSLFDVPDDMKEVIDKRRRQPDHYAQRVVCEDFYVYKPMFESVQQELRDGKRTLVRVSKTDTFCEGRFYVVEGMLVLLQSMEEKKKGSNGMMNARTRCIYENGMESDILLQTLRKNVMDDGYAVTERQGVTSGVFSSTALEDGDKSTGYVYVLRSLSADPQIAGVADLYKIGFTTQTVDERIKNAAHEPTYLMAPVHKELEAEIANMNSQKFENLVHQVFSEAQMQLKVYDDEGNVHVPKEWYVVPLGIIESVIRKIADGTITQYSYNREMQCLEKRVVKKKSTFNTEGLKVLTLNIMKCYFDEILSGEKTIEYREMKQTTINRYTYVDEADGKRYLRRYDALRLYVGYHKDRDSALVEVTDITYGGGWVEYHLGRVLEVIRQE